MTTPIGSAPRMIALYHGAPDAKLAIKLAAAGIGAIMVFQIALALVGLPVDFAIGGSYLAAIAALLALSHEPAGPADIGRAAPPEAARSRFDVLGLAAAPARFYVAGVLVGCTSWYLRLRLVALFPLPDQTHALEQATTVPSLPSTLIAIALLPAIAEELIFRGVIARSIARRSQWLAILASSVLFALYHVIPAQVIAVFPFGLAVAFIALRADSVGPTILAHVINNIIGILLARGGPTIETGAGVLDAHPNASLAVASITVAAGIAIAIRPANYVNLPEPPLVRGPTNPH